MTTPNDSLQVRLHRLFLEELDQHVDGLRTGLELLAAAAPEVPRNTIEDLFRSAHSLKGAAQAVGAAPVVELCHGLEDGLARVRDGSLPPGERLLAEFELATDAIAAAGARLQDTRAPSSTGQPSTPPRVAAPDAGPGDTVRVAPQKLYALLSQAGEVVTAIHQSERVARELVGTRDQVAQTSHQWRGSFWTLNRELAGTARDGRAARALAELDQHYRSMTEELDRLARSATIQQRNLRTVTDSFAAAAHHARTVPFADATAGLRRLVRELAAETGKQVRLELDAANVEVDRGLVGTLHDVLVHLIRNAIDHGIEPLEDRRRRGKPDAGTVTVTASLISHGIAVSVADDGRGVSADDVRQAVDRLGLGDENDVPADLDEVLFRPGLSTASEISSISGRGVGLDAVRTAVEAAGGTVTLQTEPGAGSRVEATVPLSLSTVRAVVVRVHDDVLALPSSSVATVARVPATRSHVDGRDIAEVAGRALPVTDLAGMLGWHDDRHHPSGDLEDALVLEVGKDSLALVVDEVLSEREVVLRSAPRRLAGLSLILGTSQLEDGTVMIVLSPAACVRAGLVSHQGTHQESSEPAPAPTVLLVEDTVTTRELERSILELAGYSVVVATDGEHGWQLLQEHQIDVVVSDIDMPRMDGVALCRAIRSSARLADLPVVLVTSLHSDADRQRGLDAGANAYLTKAGFDRGELLATLERVL